MAPDAITCIKATYAYLLVKTGSHFTKGTKVALYSQDDTALNS